MDYANPSAVRVTVERVRRLLADRTPPLLVALDGRSGAGKSTLAAVVAAEIGAAVVDGDDFYTGGSDAEWDARTAQEKVDMVIDWRRLRSEAIEPLLAGDAASWHPFDWEAGHGLAKQKIVRQPAPIVILDGAYSCRPELSDLVDLSVLVQAPAPLRRERLIKREGAIDDWYARWEEAEEYCFTHVRPPACFDLVVVT